MSDPIQLILLTNDEPDLSEKIIAIRQFVEHGVEVVAATPNAMRDYYSKVKQEAEADP